MLAAQSKRSAVASLTARAVASLSQSSVVATQSSTSRRSPGDRCFSSLKPAQANEPRSERFPHRHSGLQLQVLSVYRRLLRAAQKKADGKAGGLHGRGHSEGKADVATSLQANPLVAYIREEMRRNAASVGASEYARIEHMVRVAQRQAAQLEGSDVSGFRTVDVRGTEERRGERE